MPTGNDLTVSQKVIEETCGETPLPKLGTIEQVWETNPIPVSNVTDRAAATVQELPFEDVPDGGTVALGIGSRGIANLPNVVRGVVDGIRTVRRAGDGESRRYNSGRTAGETRLSRDIGGYR